MTEHFICEKGVDTRFFWDRHHEGGLLSGVKNRSHGDKKMCFSQRLTSLSVQGTMNSPGGNGAAGGGGAWSTAEGSWWFWFRCSFSGRRAGGRVGVRRDRRAWRRGRLDDP